MKTFTVSLRDFSTDLEPFSGNFSCSTSSIIFKKPLDQLDTIHDISFTTFDGFLIDVIGTWNIQSFLDIKNNPILINRKAFAEYLKPDIESNLGQKLLENNIGKVVFNDKRIYEIKTNDKWYDIVKKLTRGEWLANRGRATSKCIEFGEDDYFGLKDMGRDLCKSNPDIDFLLRHEAEMNLLLEAMFRKYNNIKEISSLSILPWDFRDNVKARIFRAIDLVGCLNNRKPPRTINFY